MRRVLVPALLGIVVACALLAGCATPRLVSPSPFSGSASDAAPPAGAPSVDEASPQAGTAVGPDGRGTDAGPQGGYPTEGRRLVGSPGDINVDIATSFPRRDSILPQVIPQKFFNWKKALYKRTGVQLAVSYQALTQRYSDFRPLADPLVTDSKTFSGGIALLEARWTPVCKGGQYEGSLEAALDWRHELFGNTFPFLGQIASGSAWGTGGLFMEWDPAVTALFWQQWLGKDTFEFRVGKQATAAVFDFFRFKDARTSSMQDPLNLDAVSIPAPPPGYGLSFKAWPFKRPSLKGMYVSGVLADMNGDPTELSPESFFKGQYFYGLEIGHNWKRNFPRDFDHVHLSLWYADKRTDPYDFPAFVPNKAGWGMKVAGSKQWGRFVAYAKFTHNEAQGGGLGVTWARTSASIGGVLHNPACVNGELGLGFSWVDPKADLLDPSPLAVDDQRDQYGIDLYWKILLTPNLGVTPGVQYILDPTLNPFIDDLTVWGLKFRWFF